MSDEAFQKILEARAARRAELNGSAEAVFDASVVENAGVMI